jgi:hypothetical protein
MKREFKIDAVGFMEDRELARVHGIALETALRLELEAAQNRDGIYSTAQKEKRFVAHILRQVLPSVEPRVPFQVAPQTESE